MTVTQKSNSQDIPRDVAWLLTSCNAASHPEGSHTSTGNPLPSFTDEYKRIAPESAAQRRETSPAA
ncbi:hypothetical protein CVT26_003481 [Gymnopilus dilepis]|uniref:Uncharacterized protein n=1 Tax=Gymnopilus dilepis TaxID=231916 RepID=A0A409W311_9AGAR|nr:hypothetical protein CVT26_003481 [Gymnopilus dilepis]